MRPTFPCPVAGCIRKRLDYQLVCAVHWRLVPLVTQRKIWLLYRSAPGGDAHRAVCFQTILNLSEGGSFET